MSSRPVVATPQDGLAAVVVAVPLGARDDPPGRGGLAHLVEHLVLRRCRDSSEPWTVNGSTSARMTLFECVTTRTHLERATAAMQGAIGQPLVPDEQEVRTELDVIDVEARALGIGVQLIGSDKDRRSLRASDVVAFHRRHGAHPGPQLVVVPDTSSPSATGRCTVPPQGWREVHLRDETDLTRIVVVFEPGDAGHAALMLALARAVDPQLPRLLALPVTSGNRRAVRDESGHHLVVSVQLTVGPDITAVAVAVAGGPNSACRHRWLARRWQENPADAPPYVFPDPLLAARWRAFWNLSVAGGCSALEAAGAQPSDQCLRAIAAAVQARRDSVPGWTPAEYVAGDV